MKNHFTPEKGWMNDPNGTIIIDGVYHIFYQYYPDDIKWGPMHWGHAISTDAVNWEHKKIAIYPDSLGYIFSGSCVLDTENVSGFGADGKVPLIAIYTSHNPKTGEQQQSVSYSLDYETFIPYSGNPVIRNSINLPTYKKDFRDPKVFKNPILGGFSLVLAVGPSIEFYHSLNLLNWQKTGSFDIGIVGLTGICECPDCFLINDGNTSKWVLSFSLCGNETSNIMPYFIGEFDGRCFVPDDFSHISLLDYGPDNYAAVTFSNSTDCQMIGWGENWTYAQDTPATDKRGKMTSIKKVRLAKVGCSYILSFSPTDSYPKTEYVVAKGGELALSTTNGGTLSICVSKGSITVDRTKAVATKFHDCFNDSAYLKFSANRILSGDCKIQIVEDDGFYEIFADDGTVMFSVNTY